MTSKIYIVLLIIFGFILGPTGSYANTNVKEKACCKKEQVTKECCKRQQHTQEKQNSQTSCKKGDCACPVLSTNFVSACTIPAISSDVFLVLLSHKNNYFYDENIHSNVFCAIWLPPKIA